MPGDLREIIFYSAESLQHLASLVENSEQHHIVTPLVATEVAAPWTEVSALNPGPFEFHSDESCVDELGDERIPEYAFSTENGARCRVAHARTIRPGATAGSGMLRQVND